MPLVYSEEQKSLVALFQKSLTGICSGDFVRNYREDPGLQQKLQQVFKDLGFFEYAADESCSLIDLCLIAKECGRIVCPTSSLYTGYLQYCSHQSWAKDLAIVPEGIAYSIKGEPFFISSKDLKTVLLIEEGSIVTSVPQFSICGIENLEPHPSIDLTEPSFTGTISSEPSRVPLSPEQANILCSELALLISAELAGLGEKMVSLTSEYVKTRRQYGVAVGSFQAVQHQLAECLLRVESCWALVECAADSSTENLNERESFSARSAILYTTRHIPEVIEICLQLHGGIGFTWEYDLHLYLRRARKLSSIVGITDQSYIDTLSLVA